MRHSGTTQHANGNGTHRTKEEDRHPADHAAHPAGAALLGELRQVRRHVEDLEAAPPEGWHHDDLTALARVLALFHGRFHGCSTEATQQAYQQHLTDLARLGV